MKCLVAPHRVRRFAVRRLAVVAGLVWALGAQAWAQSLPLQTGAINDYAAALGGKPQRAALQTALDTLVTRHGVALVLLVSAHDPFDDPTHYTAEMRHAWRVSGENNAFAVFLQEDQRWTLDLWLGAELATRLSASVADALRDQVSTLAGRGQIRQATLALAEGLLERLDQPPAAPSASGPAWLNLGSGAALGLGALVALVGWLRAFCPRCARRLRRARRYGRALKSCPSCGYTR